MIKTNNNYGARIKKKYHNALVTGGAGFIGSHLCERLAQLGLSVYSLDDFSTGKRENIIPLTKKFKNLKSIECDITDSKKTEKYFKKHRFDIVFHQAASKKTICLKDPKRDLEVNGKGTLGLLQLAQKYKVKKFVHASTGSVYGEPKFRPQTEEHPLNPTSYYGVSKLAGERYVALFHTLYGMDTTILRYFHVYGPRQEFSPYGGVVAIFIRNYLNGETPVIHGTGKQERSFTFVNDVVDANITVAVDKHANGQVYNCASGIKVTVKELLDNVAQAFGIKKPKAKHDAWLVGDIKEFDVSNAKIRKLGVKFTRNIKPGVKATIESMKQSLQKNAKK